MKKLEPNDTLIGNPPKMEASGEIEKKEADLNFKAGDNVRVMSSDGNFELGWQFLSFDGDKAVLGKKQESSDRIIVKRFPKDNLRKA